jgi:hypothetical protein
VRKNSAANPSATNIPVPISNVVLARMAIGSRLAQRKKAVIT